jgi:hypothetical protein
LLEVFGGDGASFPGRTGHGGVPGLCCSRSYRVVAVYRKWTTRVDSV